MTFLESAQEILRQNGNRPMSSKEIWNEIEEQKLVETKGKTPWASLNTILLYSSKDSPINKKTLEKYNYPEIFAIVDKNPMKFILLNYFLFNKIEEEKIENNNKIEDIQNKILLYTIINVEKFGWGKRLSLYNINNNLEFHLEDVDKITYMIFDLAQDTIKIGKASLTNTPIDRLNQMKTGNPRLELVCSFPFEQFKENDLHKEYDDFRKDREWFFNTKKIRNFIEVEKKKMSKMVELYEEKLKTEEFEKELLNLL